MGKMLSAGGKCITESGQHVLLMFLYIEMNIQYEEKKARRTKH